MIIAIVVLGILVSMLLFHCFVTCLNINSFILSGVFKECSENVGRQFSESCHSYSIFHDTVLNVRTFSLREIKLDHSDGCS